MRSRVHAHRAAIYDWLGRDRPCAIIRILKSEMRGTAPNDGSNGYYERTGRIGFANRVLHPIDTYHRPRSHFNIKHWPMSLPTFSWQENSNWIILPFVWFYVANGTMIIRRTHAAVSDCNFWLIRDCVTKARQLRTRLYRQKTAFRETNTDCNFKVHASGPGYIIGRACNRQ